MTGVSARVLGAYPPMQSTTLLEVAYILVKYSDQKSDACGAVKRLRVA